MKLLNFLTIFCSFTVQISFSQNATWHTQPEVVSCRFKGRCGVNDHCCSSFCINNYCLCKKYFSYCRSGNECCTGNCEKNQCQPIEENFCKHEGFCTDHQNCCSNFCINDYCICKMDFSPCRSGNECCGRTCVNSVCQKQPEINKMEGPIAMVNDKPWPQPLIQQGPPQEPTSSRRPILQSEGFTPAPSSLEETQSVASPPPSGHAPSGHSKAGLPSSEPLLPGPIPLALQPKGSSSSPSLFSKGFSELPKIPQYSMPIMQNIVPQIQTLTGSIPKLVPGKNHSVVMASVDGGPTVAVSSVASKKSSNSPSPYPPSNNFKGHPAPSKRPQPHYSPAPNYDHEHIYRPKTAFGPMRIIKIPG